MKIDLDLSGPSGLFFSIFVANSPQIICSFLYFLYYGDLTCLRLAEESNAPASQWKFLRVTSPKGRQRSTYRLQLPYRYGIPLLICSSTLQWLVSQSVFLARVNVINPQNLEVAELSTCGYSPMAIIFAIILGLIVVLVGISNGLRRVSVSMPLASSCSAAISAACHPPKTDVSASLKRVMWGVSNESDESVGHCTFTSLEVEAPIAGRRYAGRVTQRD